MSFLTIHWFVSCSATTTYLCWLCHSLLLDKEDCFVCLFTVAFLSIAVWVFSLAILHGMHLVVSTHHSFFWVVCHLNRKFPLKESEREPQNKLSLLPIARLYPSLTSDPWPTILVLAGYRLVVPGLCACSTFVYVKSLFAAHTFAMVWRFIYAFYHSSLTFYGMNCFLIFHSLLVYSFQGLGLAWLWVFLFLAHSLLLW